MSTCHSVLTRRVGRELTIDSPETETASRCCTYPRAIVTHPNPRILVPCVAAFRKPRWQRNTSCRGWLPEEKFRSGTASVVRTAFIICYARILTLATVIDAASVSGSVHEL